MQELIKVTTTPEGEFVIDSRIVAEELGVEHRSLLQTIKKYESEIELNFQRVAFEMTPFETAGGVQKQTVAHLTEDQALFIGSLSRNSETVVRFKANLVKAFQAARKTLASPKELSRKDLALLIVEAEEEKEKLLLENAKLAPKAEYADKVLQSVDVITTTTIAKELGMSATKLNRVLCDKKVQYKIDGHYVLYAKYQDKGYTKIKTHQYFGTKDGQAHTSHSLVWTEYGRAFIHMLINNRLSFHLQPDVKYQLTP